MRDPTGWATRIDRPKSAGSDPSSVSGAQFGPLVLKPRHNAFHPCHWSRYEFRGKRVDRRPLFSHKPKPLKHLHLAVEARAACGTADKIASISTVFPWLSRYVPATQGSVRAPFPEKNKPSLAFFALY